MSPTVHGQREARASISTGVLIVRIGFGGFWGVYYTIVIIIRNPQKPILIIKAPTLLCVAHCQARVHGLLLSVTLT